MRRALFVLVGFTAACGAAPNGPVSLGIMQPDNARGATYTVMLTQSVVWHSVLSDLKGERTYRLRFRITDATAASGDSVRATATLDSVRAVMDSPHGRQVVDTRRMVGNTFGFVYARAGGPARYDSTAPSVDYSMLGGKFPATVLIDYAFPPVPDHPVKPGDVWEHSWTRRQLDATSHTEARVTSRYTLLGFEKLAGTRVARVRVKSSGALGAEAGGPAWSKPGSIEANGYLLLGLSDGRVYELSLQETAQGFTHMGSSETPFSQNATIHLQLAGNQ